MRTNARKDGNAGAIVAGLRRAGASVQVLNEKGLPDVLVGFRKRNYLFELKTARGTLTRPQKLFLATWAGQAQVVRTLDEALLVIGAIVHVTFSSSDGTV